MRKKETPNPSRVRGRGVEVSETLFYNHFLKVRAIIKQVGNSIDDQKSERNG